jgi:TctA family transporter
LILQKTLKSGASADVFQQKPQLIAEMRMPIAVDKNPTGPFPALSGQEWLLNPEKLEGIMRIRVASLLLIIWAAVQAYFLLHLGGSPSSHVTGWVLWLITVLLALMLLTGNKLAHLVASIACIAMLTKYGWILFQYGAPPTHVAWIQPALAIAVLIALVKLPSNFSLKGTAQKRAAP